MLISTLGVRHLVQWDNSWFLDVMRANAQHTVNQHATPIHPTVTELIPTMLGELEPLG